MEKTNKTLEQYKELGAKFRVFKTMASKLSTEAAGFINKKEWLRLQNAIDIVSVVGADIEDRMFREHPELDGDYTKVFYGATTNESINDVDTDIKARAKAFCEKLF